MKITLELSESMLRALAVLSDADSAEQALQDLAARAEDGVVRPGSWERQWLFQAFGDGWTERTESDPECHWHERPRRR